MKSAISHYLTIEMISSSRYQHHEHKSISPKKSMITVKNHYRGDKIVEEYDIRIVYILFIGIKYAVIYCLLKNLNSAVICVAQSVLRSFFFSFFFQGVRHVAQPVLHQPFQVRFGHRHLAHRCHKKVLGWVRLG